MSVHIPVLLQEALDYLNVKKGDNYLDCTFGGGGHTKAILERGGKVTGLDRDMEAIEREHPWKKDFKDDLGLVHSNFEEIDRIEFDTKFQGVLVDLGVSSDQIDNLERGFSFNSPKLDMRMDQSEKLTAEKIINTYSESDLSRVLRIGGVQSPGKMIKMIIRERPITEAKVIVDIARRCQTPAELKKTRNPATLLFQGLRIEVNQEIKAIKGLLSSIPKIIAPSGRLVIISFHSMEDKLITNQLRAWQNGEVVRRGVVINKLGKLLTPKAVVASDQELDTNPRSRSALLRCFEFFEEGVYE